MIRLVPVTTPNKSPGEVEDDFQQVLITADEPVTISVCLIDIDGSDKQGHHIFVYRGALADDDTETEPVCVYDGSLGHAENGPVEV